MLREVLNMIYESRLFSSSVMAQSLGVSQEILGDLLAQLLDKAYIKEEQNEFGCDSKRCSSCSMACKEQIPIKTYSLTEKGLKYIGQPQV